MKYLFCFLFVFNSQIIFAASSEKKSVDFDSIKEGQLFKSPFKIKMKVTGVKLRPSGEDLQDTTSGHHHLLINAGPIAAGQVIPTDETHLHFGKAQTETELNLKPGDYTLTLQFANGSHLSYGPELSKSVHIKVTK